MTTSEARFRRASLADVTALLGLQAAYYGEDGYPFEEEAARAAWMPILDGDAVGRAWVAEAGGEMVAYVVLALGYSLEYRGRDAFVDELYVIEAFRGRGLGGRALEVVEDACVELGVEALHLEVERDKTGAQALYRRRGFEDHDRYLMTKRITR